MMRALLVDDEPPARDRLRRLLEEHPDLEITGEAGDVTAALALLRRQPVDVVFLDIHLPGPDGFELLDLSGPRDRPAVVCVTADAAHAVRAFDEAAVDYLLKPFSRARLADALARVRRHRDPGAPAPTPPPPRIPVPGPTGTRFVDQDSIIAVRGERNYVRLEVGDRSVLLRGTLREMAARLPGSEFARVSRSVIVRLAAVVEVQTLPHGELHLHLSTGTRIISSRSYAPAVRAALGL